MIPGGVPPLKPGETVQLKSGGPVMTVAKVSESGTTVCTWFSEKHKQEDEFVTIQLRRVPMKRPAPPAKK